MKTKISKQQLIDELMANEIVLDVRQLQKIHSWLNAEDEKVEDKWKLLTSTMKSKSVESVLSVPSVWLWAHDEKNSEKIISDNSILNFEKHLETMKGDFASSTITRTKNWIREKGFKNVAEIVEQGSSRTLSDRKMGKKSIRAVKETLEKYYAITNW